MQHHLFLLCPNNSGSSFLQKILATSQQTWNLPGEGQHALGFAGPVPRADGNGYIWASSPDWVSKYRNAQNHDWERARNIWYFQSRSRNPKAKVFTSKSPPFLLVAEQLRTSFLDARFLIMQRNPYATAVGIRRCRRVLGDIDNEAILRLAAQHLIVCFDAQRRNIEDFQLLAACFSYEEMCDEPESVEKKIQKLVPALNDIQLRQKIAVKNIYSERLRNMNAEQIAQLSSQDIAILNEEFGPSEALFQFFGYHLL